MTRVTSSDSFNTTFLQLAPETQIKLEIFMTQIKMRLKLGKLETFLAEGARSRVGPGAREAAPRSTSTSTRPTPPHPSPAAPAHAAATAPAIPTAAPAAASAAPATSFR